MLLLLVLLCLELLLVFVEPILQFLHLLLLGERDLLQLGGSLFQTPKAQQNFIREISEDGDPTTPCLFQLAN